MWAKEKEASGFWNPPQHRRWYGRVTRVGRTLLSAAFDFGWILSLVLYFGIGGEADKSVRSTLVEIEMMHTIGQSESLPQCLT